MDSLCCFGSQEEFWIDPNRSISKAYERTDQAILSHSPDLGRGGSTTVTAIIINGRRLWVANVDDSRAVLSRGGQAIQLTIDHEPNTERGRIEDRGGFVSNMPDDFVACTCRDILVYGEEIVLLYRSNIILLSSLAFVQLTIPDTENYWQQTDN